MAIRLQRVLIACGLPTLLAIVSFYWLRRRRKSVVHRTAPKQLSIEANGNVTELDSNESVTELASNESLSFISIVDITNRTTEQLSPDANQSETYCDSSSERLDTEYTMQLRNNNNNNSITVITETNVSNGCDADTDVDSSHQFISVTNNSITDQKVMESNNNTNHSSDFKRQKNCENNGNDYNSDGSSDSGKGGSDILHATPVENQNIISETATNETTTSETTTNETVVYQFEIPQFLCGRLIGSGGRFVSQIKQMTNTTVVINRPNYSSDMKICTLTGTRTEIREALNRIRNRFPIADYPNVTLQQINLINATQTCAVPQTCQLQLPSGIYCDVILSSLVSAGHFFLQQPTHPTYPLLSRLDYSMIQTYSHQNTPLLPNIHSGMICAVPIMGGWFRAVITKVYNTEECDVMFVDYGGFSRLPVSSLRQIRYDFMSPPFQASECYLANVEPIDSEIGWTAEANALFEELAQGQILQALIVGYSENGIPLVHLYKVQGVSNVFINQELVNQSHAQWIDSSA